MWNSGAAMWVRQPWRSGSRDISETAASMPASLRGAPFGVPVVPEVRITIRAWRSGAVEVAVVVGRRSATRAWLVAVVGVGPGEHPLLDVAPPRAGR